MAGCSPSEGPKFKQLIGNKNGKVGGGFEGAVR